MSEDGPLSQGRAVPAAVAELVLTLVDAQLSPFADDDDGVGAALTEGSLAWGQSRYLIADDVGTQSHHGGQRPGAERKRGSVRGEHVRENICSILFEFWAPR